MTYPQEPDNADYLQDVRAVVDGAMHEQQTKLDGFREELPSLRAELASVREVLGGEATKTAGEAEADPELGIDLVLHEPRALPDNNVGISTNLAFGGNNAVIVLRSPR